MSSIGLGQGFEYFDLMRDVNTLLNIKVMREYLPVDSFWNQGSAILGDLSRLGYAQYGGAGNTALSLVNVLK